MTVSGRKSYLGGWNLAPAHMIVRQDRLETVIVVVHGGEHLVADGRCGARKLARQAT